MTEHLWKPYWLLPALLCLMMVGASGCQMKQPTEQELQAELAKAKTDPSVLAPGWFRARYYIRGPGIENSLHGSIVGLNIIGAVILSIVCVIRMAQAEQTSWELGEYPVRGFVILIVIVIAGLVLCVVGHCLIHLVVAMGRPDGEVPFRFSTFCTLVFLDLTLIFIGISALYAKARGFSFERSETGSLKRWSRKTILLSAGKSLAVSLIGAIASHVGDWIGGVIVVAILAGVAAFFNPGSE